MSIDRLTRLFFDASCLIAAAGSPNGGSGFLLSVCARGFLKAVVSQPVLLEAERNIMEKLPRAVARYQELLISGVFEVVPVPDTLQRRVYRGLINEKDEHVLAAAVGTRAPFLITLDQPLIAEVARASLSLQACTPGTFITQNLVLHSDYPRMRE